MGEGRSLDTHGCPPSVVMDLAGAGFLDAEIVGSDDFAEIYRCAESNRARRVYVKVLRGHLAKQDRTEFFREQNAIRQLTEHPNIISILHVGTVCSDLPYFVTHCDLQANLDAQIRNDGPLPLDQVLRVGVKLAGAVEAAHRVGILHGDVKPSNIFLTASGEPQLADFGSAQITDRLDPLGTTTESSAFTAPEVLGGNLPTPAADIYGLGATLFSLLTGDSGAQISNRPMPSSGQPTYGFREYRIPVDVSATVARAISQDNSLRPATAAEFGEELRNLQRKYNFPVDEMSLDTELNGGTDTEAQHSPELRNFNSTRSSGHSMACPLPLELTSFVGRRQELAKAKNLLAGGRLVTLTGIGGVGKTRLAMRVAESVQHKYIDGVRLIELGGLRDKSTLIEAVASAVGIQDHSTRPVRDILIEHLATRELLFVIDNCEHMVSAVAELAEFLLRACGVLRILATSREPLAIEGETVLRVPPLAVPDLKRESSLRQMPKYDAVSLFTERGAAAVPGFALTEENALAVAAICLHLDGLPLPIELAAARLRAMSPEQILRRLNGRYALLSRGSRGAPTRQQTLRSCIDWSYDLCTAREQLVWCRMSIFAGSFELDAIEYVCGTDLTPEELLDTLMALVEKSILIREEHGAVVRLRMLETLRDYGHEKLERSGGGVALQRRHRDWYLALAQDAEVDWISADQIETIDRLKREQSNLREALEFSINDDVVAGLRIASALRWFWSSQGLYNEGRSWFDQLLAVQSGPPTSEWVKSLYCASVMAGIQGDLHASATLLDEARRLTAGTDDLMMGAYVDCADGMLALYSGDLPRASSRLEAALAQFSKRGERTLETSVLYQLGLVYGLSDRRDQAIKCYEHVLTITATHGEKVYRSHALWALGIAVWQQGDSERAVQLLLESLRLSRQVRSPRIAAKSIEAMAWIECEQHNAQRAAVLLGAAESVAHSVGSAAVIHSSLIAYHEICEQLSRRKLGIDRYAAAYRRGRQSSFASAIAYALHEQLTGASAGDTKSAILTKREREVAGLIADGLTNRAIAERLVISPRTAQGHVEHILTKLSFTSRAQVAAWVTQQIHEGD
ncbi:protein kinase [Rhodococcus sp. NPDC060176]|uniref:protein kinase domain-containing protein n=1 Tax=Rhodococcus sp. NPDC060176 TaxID=3347062 RepID=UPI00364CDDE9